MDLDRIKNIRSIDLEAELKEAIDAVNKMLNGLTKERMCKVYSSYLFKELRSRHVPSRIINTLDLGFNYEHEFVMTPATDGKYFLIDLTIEQFEPFVKDLEDLYNNGYIKADNNTLITYFNVILKIRNLDNCDMDNLFYGTR